MSKSERPTTYHGFFNCFGYSEVEDEIPYGVYQSYPGLRVALPATSNDCWAQKIGVKRWDNEKVPELLSYPCLLTFLTIFFDIFTVLNVTITRMGKEIALFNSEFVHSWITNFIGFDNNEQLFHISQYLVLLSFCFDKKIYKLVLMLHPRMVMKIFSVSVEWSFTFFFVTDSIFQ